MHNVGEKLRAISIYRQQNGRWATSRTAKSIGAMTHRRITTSFSTPIHFLFPRVKPARLRNWENITYRSFEVLCSAEIWQCELRNNHHETSSGVEQRSRSPCVAARFTITSKTETVLLNGGQLRNIERRIKFAHAQIVFKSETQVVSLVRYHLRWYLW